MGKPGDGTRSKVISRMPVALNFLKGRGGAGVGGGSIRPDSTTSSGDNLQGRSSRHDTVEASMFRASHATRVAAHTPGGAGSSFNNASTTPPSANIVPSHPTRIYQPKWHQHARSLGGLLSTLSCAVCIVGATFFSRRLFRWQSFHAPFFAAFFLSSWQLLFFPAYVIVRFVVERGNTSFRNVVSENFRLLRQDLVLQLNTNRLIGLLASLVLLWMLTLYALLQAVDVVDTTDVLALFATNSNFVYILSWILLHRQFISTRIVSFIISMTGIVMVTYKDTNFPSHIWGCVLTILSNAFCACYTVVFIKMFGKCTSGQLTMCISFLGAIETVTLWPIWLVLYYTGWESIEWNDIPWKELLIVSLFTIGVILVLTFGPLLVDVIFVRSAFVVAIVIGIVSEALFSPSLQLENIQIVAYLLVFFGFILNSLSQERLERLANRFWSKKNDRTNEEEYYTSYQRIRRSTISYA